jgi:hypothetical protein
MATSIMLHLVIVSPAALARTLLILFAFGAAVTGCDDGRPASPAPPAASQFIHAPSISQLTNQQLRALSMDCEKYSPDKSARGPYDAAYCDAAIAAWGDAPIQLITIKPSAP